MTLTKRQQKKLDEIKRRLDATKITTEQIRKEQRMWSEEELVDLICRIVRYDSHTVYPFHDCTMVIERAK